MGPYVTPGKVYVGLNFHKASNKIWFFIILKIHEICYKIREFLFYNVLVDFLFYNLFKKSQFLVDNL